MAAIEEAFKRYVTDRAFKPFGVITRDGREFEVLQRSNAILTASKLILGTPDPTGTVLSDHVTLDLSEVSDLYRLDLVPILRRDDHDQHFKVLFRKMTAKTLDLFWPEIGREFDLSEVLSLCEELFTDPPDGPMVRVDLVLLLKRRKPVDGKPDYELHHFEIESPLYMGQFIKRMPQYWWELRKEFNHQIPVNSWSLHLKGGNPGRWKAKNVEKTSCCNTFTWPCRRLPSDQAQKFLQHKNIVGVAISTIMTIEPGDKAQHLAEVLRRIARSKESQENKQILTNFSLYYIRLNTAQMQEFLQIIENDQFREARTMTKTFRDMGREEGLEQGLKQGLNQGRGEGLNEGLQKAVLLTVGGRYKPANSQEIESKVKTMTSEQLEAILSKIMLPGTTLDQLGLASSNGAPITNGAAY